MLRLAQIAVAVWVLSFMAPAFRNFTDTAGQLTAVLREANH